MDKHMCVWKWKSMQHVEVRVQYIVLHKAVVQHCRSCLRHFASFVFIYLPQDVSMLCNYNAICTYSMIESSAVCTDLTQPHEHRKRKASALNANRFVIVQCTIQPTSFFTHSIEFEMYCFAYDVCNFVHLFWIWFVAQWTQFSRLCQLTGNQPL